MQFRSVKHPGIVKDDELEKIIQPDLKDFISLMLALPYLPIESISRHHISRLLLEATKCEEMLDAYGAKHNRHWLPFRVTVAMAKSFSRVIYNLFHIQLSAPGYKLLKVEGDFIVETEKIRTALIKALSTDSMHFKRIASKLHLCEDLHPYRNYDFSDYTVRGSLKADITKRKLSNSYESAVYVASNLLHLADLGQCLNIEKNTDQNEYAQCIPDRISEEKLRTLADSFHSMQSIYDTNLGGSLLAEKDNNLSIMRGNLTVVFHLLDTAVTLIHFYERHMAGTWYRHLHKPISTEQILGFIVDYFANYANRFLLAIKGTCREILKTYSIQDRIAVPIPSFRGFHVRPSQLIASIVTHYGSNVSMVYDNVEYDVSNPMNIFMANEALNKNKRKTVMCYITDHRIIKKNANMVLKEEQMRKLARLVFLALIDQNAIILYQTDFSFSDVEPGPDETFLEYIKRIIILYLSNGKIDIISKEKVVFKGDKRVLEDICILAKNGYGEDKLGKDIALPDELSYLRLSRKSAPNA